MSQPEFGSQGPISTQKDNTRTCMPKEENERWSQAFACNITTRPLHPVPPEKKGQTAGR